MHQTTVPRLIRFAFLLAPSVGGCLGEESDGRRLSEITWDEKVIIGGSAADTTLSIPVQIIADDQGFVILDGVPPFVRAFDLYGQPTWTFGRTGEGPEEFKNPYRMVLNDRGNLLVLDARLYRLTEIGRDGLLERVVHIGLTAIGVDMAIVGDRLVIPVSGLRFGTVFLDLDSLGEASYERLEWADTIVAGASRANGGLKLSRLVAGLGESWVSAPRVGPGFFLHRGGKEKFVPYIDPGPVWIGSVERLSYAAQSLMVDSSRILILSGGRLEPPPVGRVLPNLVDTYAFDGDYLETFRLPTPVFELIEADGRFLGLVHEPYPALVEFTSIPPVPN